MTSFVTLKGQVGTIDLQILGYRHRLITQGTFSGGVGSIGIYTVITNAIGVVVLRIGVTTTRTGLRGVDGQDGLGVLNFQHGTTKFGNWVLTVLHGVNGQVIGVLIRVLRNSVFQFVGGGSRVLTRTIGDVGPITRKTGDHTKVFSSSCTKLSF